MTGQPKAMTHREKVVFLYEDKGRNFTIAPPVFRLAWKLGWRIRPPVFQSFALLAVEVGVPFGVLMGAVDYFVAGGAKSAPDFASAVFLGVFFGLFVATNYWHLARQLGLPAWEEYPGEEAGR